MNNLNLMNWQAFKNTLLEQPDKILQFQYADGKLVDASYHITEIKQAPIVSVDCGGVMNSWTEIIVQLWEPSISETDHVMKVSKALSIIGLVEKSLALNPLGIIKIEFGNSRFDTRQMYPVDFILDGDFFTVNLAADFTQCKAITRGQSCGTNDSSEDCCTPENKVKSIREVEVKELAGSENAGCVPGGGCC
jgi:hypothetical protein